MTDLTKTDYNKNTIIMTNYIVMINNINKHYRIYLVPIIYRPIVINTDNNSNDSDMKNIVKYIPRLMVKI